MKSVSMCLALCILLVSCSSGASNIPQLANDMCKCFESAQMKMDAETVAFFELVKNSDNQQLTLQQEMAKLKPEKLKTVTDIILSVGNKESDVYKCLSDFDKNHTGTKTTNRQKLATDIAAKMKEDKSCVLGSVVMSMGAKSIK
jgi:hypothetical protein